MQRLRIAITGAGGFIGSNLVASLATENIDTVLITGPERNVQHFPDAIITDVAHYDKLKDSLAGTNIIVHLAGLNGVRESFDDPAASLNVNTIGTTTLLNVCREAGIEEVIIISSAEVYGRPVANPVSEEDLMKPLSPYGVSKAAIEQLCFVYHVAHDIKFKILRPFSIYGPKMSRKTLIYEIYNQTKTQGDVTLFNCASVRDYCFVDDLSAAIKKAAFSDFKGFEVYNIGTGIGTNSKQLATLIKSVMKDGGTISQRVSSDRPRKADIEHLIADISKAQEELKWRPETSLLEGLQRTINSFSHE